MKPTAAVVLRFSDRRRAEVQPRATLPHGRRPNLPQTLDQIAFIEAVKPGESEVFEAALRASIGLIHNLALSHGWRPRRSKMA